ncbi:hypothetical protein [Polynucleobacter sp.]|jgi:hypothetical protein|uniref:hypothetical protein n=1 Tax=Polynucleobacter sp. TaxID=2029855 RepID=UPI003F69F54F
MPAQRKASDKPTSVKEVLDKKQLPVKKKAAGKASAKKPSKKVAQKKKPAAPKITPAMFEKHFYALSHDEFKALCEVYNEQQLKIKITKQPDYDHWLNYFKGFPASHIRLLVRIGQDMLDAEAYSALRMWHDIISNPQRIAKIHQSTLTGPKGKDGQGIMAMALKNDRMGVLMATRDKLAEKLEKGAGARDTAALARELTEVMTAISDYEKRLGPKKETVLGQLLSGTPGSTVKNTEGKKRPAKNGSGRRNTSFASRVTIKDVEND